MSYSISAFHPDVKLQALSGKELDSFEHTCLGDAAVADLRSKLALYDYKLQSESGHVVEYVKLIESCPIQVSIFRTEVSFSVPYWKGSEEAIFEVLQDASELCEAPYFDLFNPQEGVWSDA